ncbi:MAG: pentapeptide repeat-containing protein [Candidatus Brocadiia bacterium]
MPADEERTENGYGTVEGPCLLCDATIPAGAIVCPQCGSERSFRQEQWEKLHHCSGPESIVEWNAWREHNPETRVLLEAADLRGAKLRRANLKGAKLHHANLKDARLLAAELEGANLWRANLREAGLQKANLEGADLAGADIRGLRAKEAIVDGRTLIAQCGSATGADFTTVGLSSARIEPGLRGVLERNVREIAWRRWYRANWLRRWVLSLPVRAFWWVSDYGHSTGRILGTFFVLSVLFALIYCAAARFFPPGVVTGLLDAGGDPVPAMVQPLRALYFSIVTMTTLGFGDLYAQPDSRWGHLLLMLQVLLGYVLLGALITQFAIMFTGTSGPQAGG